jgi:hypothetical protein
MGGVVIPLSTPYNTIPKTSTNIPEYNKLQAYHRLDLNKKLKSLGALVRIPEGVG